MRKFQIGEIVLVDLKGSDYKGVRLALVVNNVNQQNKIMVSPFTSNYDMDQTGLFVIDQAVEFLDKESAVVLNYRISINQSEVINSFGLMPEPYWGMIQEKIKEIGANIKYVTYGTFSGGSYAKSSALILTEGKTDWKHLKKALEKLQLAGQYPTLKLDFLEYEEEVKMGDADLQEMCRQYAKMKHREKHIFVFDRDNASVVKEMAGEQGFKDWGNHVYSLCIPVPTHRQNYKNISIEMYYRDDEIRTVDPNTGRRLHFSNEVEEHFIKSLTTGNVKQRRYVVSEMPDQSEELDKKIYDDKIDQIKDTSGKQVALSKAVFANYILQEKEGFAHFDATPFSKIFDVIQEIASKISTPKR